jgi:hypothetical protein
VDPDFNLVVRDELCPAIGIEGRWGKSYLQLVLHSHQSLINDCV